MRSQNDQEKEPPTLPELRRGFRLDTIQWVGIPLLATIPALALAGVFGEASETVRARGRELEVAVEYPSRLRYEQGAELTVFVTSHAAAPLDTVEVEVDTAYVNAFGSVDFIPAAERAYVVPLAAVRPGETRVVRVELRGRRAGRVRGSVAATSGGPDTTRAALATRVLP